MATNLQNKRLRIWAFLPLILLACFALGTSFPVCGQQYFISPVRVSGAGQDSLLQYTLLYVDDYGRYTAKARLQQGEWDSDGAETVYLKEPQNLGVNGADSIRYVFADSIASPGNEAVQWVKLRYVFTWQKDAERKGLGFYNLTRIDYQHAANGWTASTARIYNFSTTKPDAAVLKQFYTDAEIQSQLFPAATRGILPPAFRQSVMHLFIVANTLDPSIGEAAKVDVKNITETFTAIASNLGLRKPLIRTYAGNNFNKQRIENDLRRFKPAANDIVIFYYTGHGFRWPEDGGNFPRIDFNDTSKAFNAANSLRIQQVYDILKPKGARFTLVLSDCCNRSIPTNSVKGPRSLATRKVSYPFNFTNASRLFLPPQPTAVIATAAKPEELAGCNPSEGSYFTINFYLTLLYGVSTHPNYKNATWSSMMVEVRKFTEDRGKTAQLKQTVYWD